MISEKTADFILLVLSLASNYHDRTDCPNRKAAEAAQKIADRYSELKRTMSFDEASRQAKIEFLTSLTLD